MVKPLSKRTRMRLLAIASILDRLAARIRRYVASRTPRRGPRNSAARLPSHHTGVDPTTAGGAAADPEGAA